jgi:hypothetical protein
MFSQDSKLPDQDLNLVPLIVLGCELDSSGSG